MEFTGIDLRRLHFSWVSASEAIKWVDLINNITDDVKKLGPFIEYKGLKGERDLGKRGRTEESEDIRASLLMT